MPKAPATVEPVESDARAAFAAAEALKLAPEPGATDESAVTVGNGAGAPAQVQTAAPSAALSPEQVSDARADLHSVARVGLRVASLFVSRERSAADDKADDETAARVARRMGERFARWFPVGLPVVATVADVADAVVRRVQRKREAERDATPAAPAPFAGNVPDADSAVVA